MTNPVGYYIGFGYKGVTEDGEWQLFCTEKEYDESLEENEENNVSDVDNTLNVC